MLAGRGNRRAYFAEKLVLIAALCGAFLLAGMLLSDAAYAVLGFSYERTETVAEYWSWAGLSWLVLTSYAFLAALIAWVTRSKVAGVVFAALVPTGFLESMLLSAAAVLAPAMPLVGDAMQWLPLSVQQRLAAGGTGPVRSGRVCGGRVVASGARAYRVRSDHCCVRGARAHGVPEEGRVGCGGRADDVCAGGNRMPRRRSGNRGALLSQGAAPHGRVFARAGGAQQRADDGGGARAAFAELPRR